MRKKKFVETERKTKKREEKINKEGGSRARSKNKRRKKKNKWIIIVSVMIVAVAIIIGVIVLVLDRNNRSSDKGYHEIKEGEDISNIQAEVKSSEDYVEPDKGTLDIDKIQGFTASSAGYEVSDGETSDGDSSAQSNSQEETSSDTPAPTISLSDPNLTVEAVGSYSGNFLEDGSDEPTANVAAMLITNNSDQMLQIAEITFHVNDTETASFKVTDLPVGTSTLVLEANKREYSEEDSYTYGETATGYMEQPSLEEDKFDLVTEDGKITLKNKTDQSYDKVYVYYKYVQLGGAYLGGITYRTPFENVPANGEVESIAAHFNPESSKIMAVQIQQEQ